ncbi:hypothetical protein RhiirC2_869283 [Rhizophagus irregularis]|uniref:Ion transport domain-containing protein n=1 Tax=Rhizophagus irregularis TaxID=588596 RepID=A0A2N1MS81_9GLOM|nr:hypothetical protein RhiirC2_869283 [Rhizophagus irregularis]
MEENQEKKYSLIQTTPSFNSDDDYINMDTNVEMTSLDYSSLPFRQVIDVVTFSPNGEHIATYASKEGKLVIWQIKNRGLYEERAISKIEPIWHSNPMSTDLKPRDYWEYRKSFVSSFTQKLRMTNIDFALSNDGKYVALSLIKLPQDEEDLTAFELVHPPPNKATKFYTYIVKRPRDRPVFRRYLMRLTGTIKFTEDSESFVICNVENVENNNNFTSQTDEINFIYVISTDSWKIRHKLVINNFTDTLQVIPHPWSQINTVKNSLLPGHFIFVEQWDTALLWSLSTGQLVSRFKCVQNDSFLDADASPTLFALSHNQQMLAAWTSKGVLTIFLCEGGLVFASSLHNTNKIDVSLTNLNKLEIHWLEDDEHIITTCSTGTDSAENCVQIWDIYTCEIFKKFNNIKSTCLFEPNGKNIYVTFKDDLPKLHEIETPKSYQIQNSKQKIIGKHHFLESGFNKIYEYNSKELLYEYPSGSKNESMLHDDHPIVELRIEPWLIYAPIKSGFCLDPNRERVLFIGHYTVQIWIFKNGEPPRLQFIWCRPVKNKKGQTSRMIYATIDDATLRRSDDGRYVVALRCQVNEQDHRSPSKVNIHQPPELSKPPIRLMTVVVESENIFRFDLLLPDENESGTFDIVSNAARSLGYLAYIERLNWIQISSKSIRDHFRKLLTQCQTVICDAIHNHSHVFNHIVDGQSPLEILIKVDCSYADKLIKEHLKTDKHIPRFHDSDRTKSALSRAINLGKTEVVHLLLDYYCRRCEENPISWTITVVPAFASLRTVYPDFALEFMRRISYLPVRDDIIRTDQEENYAYAKLEELEREAEENLWQRLMTWWSKSEKEIDRQIESATELVRIPHKTHPARECVVPLPDFTVYKPTPKSMQEPVETSKFPFMRRIWNYMLYRKHKSPFVEEALSGRYEMFGEPAIEAIINFKWRKFARIRAFFLLSAYLFYATAFLIGVSIKEDNIIRKIAMIIVLFIGSAYFGLELMQMFGQLGSYWFNPYNLLDLARSVFPMVVAEQYIRDEKPSEGLRGTAMMFVYLNFILQLRMFRNIGVPIFIIFQIIRKVFWVIVIIGGMVFAFAHILHILLRDGGDPGSDFDKYNTSLISVYLFLVGEFGPVDHLKERVTIIVMIVVFTFVSAIVLLNVLIALMSDVVTETKLSGKQAWLKQKAEIIAELEMYTFTPAQRRRKDYFPSLIYYFANPDSIKRYEKIDKEEEEEKSEEESEEKQSEDVNHPLQKPEGMDDISEVKRSSTLKLKRGATLKLI